MFSQELSCLVLFSTREGCFPSSKLWHPRFYTGNKLLDLNRPRSWLAMAFITIWESPSRIISLRPNSHEKNMSISVALALATRAPNGYRSFLLRAPMIWPLSFQTTTLIPHWPRSVKTAPSTFVLYQPGGGGFHRVGVWDWGALEGIQWDWNSAK